MSEFRLAGDLRRLDGPVIPDDGISDQIWDRLVAELTDPATPRPDSRLGRGILVAAVACVAVLVFAVPLLFLGGDGDVPVGSPETTDLVSQWIEGAVEGEFGEIGRLTYGEFGEPEALDRLARQIHAYSEEYGPPSVEILPLGSGDTLDYTCVDIRFGDVRYAGAIVTRTWPEIGTRLWEFRTNTEGCPGASAATTTMPDLSGVGDPLPHEPLGPEPRFDTSDLGEEVRLLPIDVRTPPINLRAEGDITVIGRVDGTDVEVYQDTGERQCVWFLGQRLAESRCSLATEPAPGFSTPAYAVTRRGADGEPEQTILWWQAPVGTSVVALDLAGTGRWQRPFGGHVVFVLDPTTPTTLANVTAYGPSGENLGGSGIIVPDSP